MGPIAMPTRTRNTAWGRRGGIAALAALLTLAVGGAASSPADPSAQAAAPVNVSMMDNFFDPAKRKVKEGGKVRWTNNGQNPHNVSFGPGGFASGNVAPGGSVARRFKRAGKFSYVCTIHAGMRGTVRVVR